MDVARKNISVLFESITKYMSSLTYNPKLAITLSIAFVIIIVLHIVILHVEISNTGKLLWNPRSYQYIKIKPKEDYLQLLKPDGSNLKSKEITIGDDKITLSYERKDDYQPFFKLLDSKIDQIKLLEYAYRKCFEIVYDKNKPVARFRNIKLMIGIYKYEATAEFAGASVGEDKNIHTNNEYLQSMYEDTTEEEFIIYYIGLFIHEIFHILNDFPIIQVTIGKARFGEYLAEYVRLVSGFQRNTKYWKVTKTSETVPPSYGAYGSYFLYWLNEKYPGFIQKLISDMYTYDEIKTHKTVTGKSEEELFAEFQKELPYF